MAQHYKIDISYNEHVKRALDSFRHDVTEIKDMTPFKRYGHKKYSYMRLTDRNDIGDIDVVTIFPMILSDDEGIIDNRCVCEIHLGKDYKINKLYCVL